MADRWKWLLLALAAFGVAANVFYTYDAFGAGSHPWFGWVDVNYIADGRPFEYVLDAPNPGGAAEKAGLRAGDTVDLREQSVAARVGLLGAPFAGVPIPVVVHRGSKTLHVVLTPTSTLQTNAWFKGSAWLLLVLDNLWLIGCAVLIALWRPERFEGRMLAIVLLATSLAGGFVVVPSPVMTAFLLAGTFIPAIFAGGVFVALASRMGTPTVVRRVLEILVYVIILATLTFDEMSAYAVVTLRFDPLPFTIIGTGYPVGPAVSLQAMLAISVVAVVTLAIASASRADRVRVAWLLIPLPLGAILSLVFGTIAGIFHSSPLFAVFVVLIGFSQLSATLAVTYAVVKRRVLDIEFVVSRTLVVAIISLIVVVAFTLLEWALGTVLAGLSRTAGIVVNAGLALVLGLSLRFIHQRVDGFVDATFFRKRHADERALLDFAKEAAYVTKGDALSIKGSRSSTVTPMRGTQRCISTAPAPTRQCGRSVTARRRTSMKTMGRSLRSRSGTSHSTRINARPRWWARSRCRWSREGDSSASCSSARGPAANPMHPTRWKRSRNARTASGRRLTPSRRRTWKRRSAIRSRGSSRSWID